jgi:hypothetical protein
VFGWGWKPGVATIAEKRVLTPPAGAWPPVTVRHEYIVEVRPEDNSAPFVGTVSDPLDPSGWHPPSIGDTVKVRYRTSTRQLKFDQTDLRREDDHSTNTEPEAEAERRWQQRLAAPVVSAPRGPGRPPVDAVQRRTDQAAMSAMTSDMAATLEAIKRARAAEDEAEVSRLKAAYRLRAAVRNQSPLEPPGHADTPDDPLDRMEKFEHIAGLMRALVHKRLGASAERIGLLERLAALHDRGVLTDEEFATEKARVLNG